MRSCGAGTTTWGHQTNGTNRDFAGARALPPLRLGRHPRGQPLRLHPLQGPLHLPGLPGAVRPLQGPVTVTATAVQQAKRKPVFHSLRVAELERITDDGVAITFEVPEELREEYRFLAGQHVALRCRIAGTTCAATTRSASPATTGRLRVGVKRLPGASSPPTQWSGCGWATPSRCSPPPGASAPRWTRPRPGTTAPWRPGRGSPRSCPSWRPHWRSSRPAGPPSLRQPDQRQHHVPGGAGGPQEPPPGPLPADPRAAAGDPGGRAAVGPP